MVSPHIVVRTYRSVLRELSRSSPNPGVAKPLSANFRTVLEEAWQNDSERAVGRVQAAVSFLEAQRKYKDLLDRYNPLIDLTGEERIEATARRVGLNMPVTPSPA